VPHTPIGCIDNDDLIPGNVKEIDTEIMEEDLCPPRTRNDEAPRPMSTAFLEKHATCSMSRYQVEDQFAVLPVWDGDSDVKQGNLWTFRTLRTSAMSKEMSGVLPIHLETTSLEAKEHDKTKCHHLLKVATAKVIHPYSNSRVFWDILSLVFITYDMFLMPLGFFDPPKSTFLKVMEWMTRLFWTSDIGMSFITGHTLADGRLVMDMRGIAKMYMKTWFVLDFAIVSSDWAEVIFQGSALGYAQAGKTARFFRVIRMLRLIRLARMKEVISAMCERFESEKLSIIFNLVKMTILTGAVAHVFACLWWEIGKSGDENSWIKRYGYDKADFDYQYSMSLHWSLSQFSGGMDEITPENTLERTFAIVALLFTFVVGIAFVSQVTSSMTQLQIISSQDSVNLTILRRYLRQNNVTSKLAIRVQRSAQYAIEEQQRLMPEEDVHLLSTVSEPLRVELHFEMYEVVFKSHPFFSYYTLYFPHIMRKVCHHATSTSKYAHGDVIFNAGEIPSQPRVYIVRGGVLEYKSAHDEKKIVVTEGQWISEACLWTKWHHRGVLSAASDCRLVLLDAKRFRDIVCHFSSELHPTGYASSFVRALNETSKVTDLPICVEIDLPGDDHGSSWLVGATKSNPKTRESE